MIRVPAHQAALSPWLIFIKQRLLMWGKSHLFSSSNHSHGSLMGPFNANACNECRHAHAGARKQLARSRRRWVFATGLGAAISSGV